MPLPPPELATLQAVPAASVSKQMTPAAAWYFAREIVALDARLEPALPIWLAGRDTVTVTNLQLSPLRAQCLQPDQSMTELSLALAPALASNPTYINSNTLQFFTGQTLRLRGDWRGDQFVVRTFWPQAWQLERRDVAADVRSNEIATGDGMQWLARERAAALQPFSCRSLWQSQTVLPSAPRWAIGIMLNGAQGDDDEAHGGHFALVLGQLPASGVLSDLLVANFYNPDVFSEKGILPALVPLDDYLNELNAGQQQYRPSWLLLLELASDEALAQLYPQLAAVLQQLYDHRTHYNHVDNNCTGLSMDALRHAGLNVAMAGPSSRLLAPLVALKQAVLQRSWQAGRDGWRYLLAEQTRLLPWQAFAASQRHLLALLQGLQMPVSTMERALVQQAVAVHGISFPQIPSARARGREPAATLMAYQQRVPANRADWHIIPVPVRTFPSSLRPLVTTAVATTIGNGVAKENA